MAPPSRGESAGGNAGRFVSGTIEGGNPMITSRPFDPQEVAWIAKILGVADEVDLIQLRRGMDVELEHGRRDPLTDVTNDDPLITAKIAIAHLREMPDYYDRLARMEAEGGRAHADA
jgi:hypothetical protein